MKARNRATVCIVCVCAGAVAPLRAQTRVHGGAQIVIGKNVRVSAARPDVKHDEVMLCAHPSDPDRMLSVSHMRTGMKGNRIQLAAYITMDNGKTWQPAVDSREYENGSADPACAYGRDGSVYFSGVIRVDSPGGRSTALYVYRSQDGGRTWSRPVIAPGSSGIDRPYVVVDNTGDEYDGRVYVNANMALSERDVNGDPVPSSLGLFRSLDRGASFGHPLQRILPSRDYGNHNGNLVVLSDGTVGWIYSELTGLSGSDWDPGPGRPNSRIRFVSSEDGAETMSNAITVGDHYFYWQVMNAAIPSFAADPGSQHFKDRLYAVWTDGRSGRASVLLAYSSDKGKTWSRPRVVSDERPFTPPPLGPHAMLATVAVNKAGVVGVSWYDARENPPPQQLGWQIRFAASLDGGDTFLPSTVVSKVPSDRLAVEVLEGGTTPADTTEGTKREGSIEVALNPFWRGHTAGLAADAAGGFHGLWVDARTGTPQVWTAPVTVHGEVVPHGLPALADLDDVSRRIELEMGEMQYDLRRNTVTVDAWIKNASDAPLHGPIVVRVISLESSLGWLEAANSDNGQARSGATWDFSTTLPAGRLEPQQESGIKQLRFRVSDLRPQGLERTGSLIRLEAQVLGGHGSAVSSR